MVRLINSRTRSTVSAFLVIVVGAAGTAQGDFTFGEPVLFDQPVNSTGIEYFGCISADGLEVYIDKPVSGGIASQSWDIYVSTRETVNDPWSVPVSVGPTVQRGHIGGYESLSNDGLELYFSSTRPGGHGLQDIWVTTRDSKSDDWDDPVNLGPPINNASNDLTPWIAQDGLELYFSSDRPGGYGAADIWVARRATTNDEWGEPENLGPPVNTTGGDYNPCLSPDGLVLFFSDYDNPDYGFRPGGYGRSDIWMARRNSTADPWESPVNLGPNVNTQCFDSQPRLSPDGSVLYFTSSRPETAAFYQNSDIWRASIIPIADLNGDGKVDGEDVLIMAECWGQDDRLCDVGPCPWGDGVVDVEDLKALGTYIGRDVDDPTLVAHWALDETAGDVVADCAGDHPGTLTGACLWCPDAGQVDGALELNGASFVVADRVVNPSQGPFSILAWIKGGAPGQVIMSQDSVSDWLAIDAESGGLMTAIAPPQSRHPTGPLVSDAIVSDGFWHRIALVWDGASRSLYADGTFVAADEQETLVARNGSLNIGCDKDQTAGTFFTGLVDDIRVYNRAVRP